MRQHPLVVRASRRRGILVAVAAVALVLVVGVAGRLSSTSALLAAVDVTITTAPGETLAFRPVETTIRATGPIAITLSNGSSLAHNLVFTDGLTGATRTIVEPGTSDRLVLASAVPGEYPFACTIHQGMAGRLIVLAGADG